MFSLMNVKRLRNRIVYVSLSPDRVLVRMVGTEHTFDDEPVLLLVPPTDRRRQRTNEWPCAAIGAVVDEAVHDPRCPPESIVVRPLSRLGDLILEPRETDILLEYAVSLVRIRSGNTKFLDGIVPWIRGSIIFRTQNRLTDHEIAFLVDFSTHRSFFGRPYFWAGPELSDEQIQSRRFPGPCWVEKPFTRE
jgi:hypothetical protein